MISTSLALTALPITSSFYLEQVVLSALVTATDGGSPMGTVAFTDNVNDPLCGAAMLTPQEGGGSIATCPTTMLSLGMLTITANYLGQGDYGPSMDSIPYTVIQDVTTTTIGTPIPPTQSFYDEQVQFPVTVMGNYGTPGGTVTVTDNGVAIPICTSLPLMAGQQKSGRSSGSKLAPQQNQSTANCVVTTLAVGDHMIVANYNGDDKSGGFAGSMSDPVPYTVIPEPTTTTIGTPIPPVQSFYDEQVQFPVTVMGNYGAPGGTVTLTDNGNPVTNCTLTPGQNNQSTANCLVSTLAVGDHPDIVANYNGDDKSGGFAASMSSPVDYKVIPDVTTTTIGTPIPPIQSFYDEQVQFPVTVMGNYGAPGGTVTVTDNGTPIPSCTNLQLTAGQQKSGRSSGSKLAPQQNQSTANCVVYTLAVGDHMIVANYNGDDPSGGFAPEHVRSRALQSNPRTDHDHDRHSDTAGPVLLRRAGAISGHGDGKLWRARRDSDCHRQRRGDSQLYQLAADGGAAEEWAQ